MKAQFIKENLDFERGQDPKEAMGIGDAATYQKIADMMLKDGWTPQDPYETDSAAGWAVEYKHHELVKFILDRRIPSNIPDLIQWASMNRDLEMVELLLSYKPDPLKLDFVLRKSQDHIPSYNLIKNYTEKEVVDGYFIDPIEESDNMIKKI